MSVSVSILMPAYNEAGRIAASLAEVLTFARGYPTIKEVIVVDDGSSDRTADLVTSLISGQGSLAVPRLTLVRHAVNRGKGASVRTGFQVAGGDIVLFTDADLSAPITELPRLVEPIVAGECDVAIGSRAVDPSKIELTQGVFRQSAGRMFNRMVRSIAGLDLLDTQCGFKAFRRSSMLPALEMQRIDGFAFDVELLYLAKRMHLRIVELPVRWSHAHGSKVSMYVHTWEMARDLLRIRWNDLTGRYGPRSAALPGPVPAEQLGSPK